MKKLSILLLLTVSACGDADTAARHNDLGRLLYSQPQVQTQRSCVTVVERNVFTKKLYQTVKCY